MTDAADQLRRIIRRCVDSEGLGPLARRTGLGIGQIRSIYTGRAPLLTTVTQACDALGYELVIRPRSAVSDTSPAPFPSVSRPPESDASKKSPPSEPALAPGAEPVPDRAIAEILAALADEYESLNGHGRESLRMRFWATHPDLRERERRLGRVVAWLGWRVVEGMREGPAAASKESKP